MGKYMLQKSNSSDFHAQFKKNVAYKLADDVAEICAPLSSNFPLGYFSYVRMYKDSSTLWLYNNRKWIDYYTKENHPLLVNPAECQTGLYLWDSTMCPKALRDGAANLNLHNGMFIAKYFDNFMEYIELASSSPDYYPIEFCCNKKDELNNFYFYFKQKAADLIKKADKDRLLPPSTLFKTKVCQQNCFDSNEVFNAKKIPMLINSVEVSFSPREFEVLSLLAEGYAMKQVAKSLNISVRTAETHLQHTKSKSQSFTTMQLINAFRNNLFL
jgi:DNA-binding CsgD family transcriptional regulator